MLNTVLMQTNNFLGQSIPKSLHMHLPNCPIASEQKRKEKSAWGRENAEIFYLLQTYYNNNRIFMLI